MEFKKIKVVDYVFAYQDNLFININEKKLHLVNELNDLLVFDINNNELNVFQIMSEHNLNFNDKKDIKYLLNVILAHKKYVVYKRIGKNLYINGYIKYLISINNIDFEIFMNFLYAYKFTQKKVDLLDEERIKNIKDIINSNISNKSFKIRKKYGKTIGNEFN